MVWNRCPAPIATATAMVLECISSTIGVRFVPTTTTSSSTSTPPRSSSAPLLQRDMRDVKHLISTAWRLAHGLAGSVVLRRRCVRALSSHRARLASLPAGRPSLKMATFGDASRQHIRVERLLHAVASVLPAESTMLCTDEVCRDSCIVARQGCGAEHRITAATASGEERVFGMNASTVLGSKSLKTYSTRSGESQHWWT